MKNFKGKIVVITGAGSGIGKETAIAFAREGSLLHISDINADRIETVAEQIRSLGAEAHAYSVDSSDRDAMKRFADAVFTAAGRVDILLNNAGIGAACSFDKIPLEQWRSVIDVNLWGVIYGLHYFLPGMISQGGGGHVINTASGAGLIGLPNQGAYTATKFAVVGLSEVMNIDLVKHGIYTTVVCPGIIATNIIDDTLFGMTGEEDKKVRAKVNRFYKRSGVHPEVVARDIVKAVRKKKPLVLSPWRHMWPVWMLKRISVKRYQSAAREAAKRIHERLGV